MSSTTNLDKLKINYLTQEQYEDAVENEEINENELYFTPGHNNDAIIPVELTQAEYDALTTEQKNNGMVYCVSDANGTYLTASEVSYGSSSVQDALDDLGDDVSSLGSGDTIINRVRYVKGFYSTARSDTMAHRIQDFLSMIGDSDTICIFDVIIHNAGQFRFSGYVYSGQLYGAGIVYQYSGNPVYWKRTEGNDYTVVLQSAQ